MLTELVSFSLSDAKTPALRTVSTACRKNGNEDSRSPLLKLAYLAWEAVQHEVEYQGNYDALLYFSVGFETRAGAQHS
jgi:hypothetical protein